MEWPDRIEEMAAAFLLQAQKDGDRSSSRTLRSIAEAFETLAREMRREQCASVQAAVQAAE